jgi:prepilin-type N-terminal cleavage/methylation domain-containing protein
MRKNPQSVTTSFPSSWKKQGVTLIEMMVAFVIFCGLSATVYYLMKDAAAKRALAHSRTIARQEAERILTTLQRDLSQAQAGVFGTLNTTQPEFGITLPEGIATVSYLFDPPRFIRRTTAPGHQAELVLSDHLNHFSLEKQVNEGQVLAEVEIKVRLETMLENQAVKFHQTQIITMRADASSRFDAHWVDGGGVALAQTGQSQVLAGIGGDFSDPGEEILGNMAEVANRTEAELAAKTQEIVGKVRQIIEHLNGIDDSISQMPANRLVYNDSNSSAGLPSILMAGANLKSTFRTIRNARDLNWGQFQGIAVSHGCTSPSGEFQQFYNGKERMFNSGKRLLDILRAPPFNKTGGQLGQLVGPDVSRFD